jgi:hypothetical protein
MYLRRIFFLAAVTLVCLAGPTNSAEAQGFCADCNNCSWCSESCRICQGYTPEGDCLETIWSTCGAEGNCSQHIETETWWIGERMDGYTQGNSTCYVREYYCTVSGDTCQGPQYTCTTSQWSEDPVTLEQCRTHNYLSDCGGCHG